MHNPNEEFESAILLAIGKLEAEAERAGAGFGFDWPKIIELLLSVFDCGDMTLAKAAEKYPRVFDLRVTRAVRWAHPHASRSQVDSAKSIILAALKKAKAEEQAAFVAAAG